MTYDVESCYDNGDLARALMLAANFVIKIGERNVHHIFAYLDENIPGAWWVDVIYERKTK